MNKRRLNFTNSKGMWALVRFIEDDILYVVKARKSSKFVFGSKHNIRWKDGKAYPATVLKLGCKRDVIAEQKSLECETPSTKCESNLGKYSVVPDEKSRDNETQTTKFVKEKDLTEQKSLDSETPSTKCESNLGKYSVVPDEKSRDNETQTTKFVKEKDLTEQKSLDSETPSTKCESVVGKFVSLRQKSKSVCCKSKLKVASVSPLKSDLSLPMHTKLVQLKRKDCSSSPTSGLPLDSRFVKYKSKLDISSITKRVKLVDYSDSSTDEEESKYSPSPLKPIKLSMPILGKRTRYSNLRHKSSQYTEHINSDLSESDLSYSSDDKDYIPSQSSSSDSENANDHKFTSNSNMLEFGSDNSDHELDKYALIPLPLSKRQSFATGKDNSSGDESCILPKVNFSNLKNANDDLAKSQLGDMELSDGLFSLSSSRLKLGMLSNKDNSSSNESNMEEAIDFQCESITNDVPKVKVALSSSTVSRRVWDRKTACVFCNKLICKLGKHLVAKHSGEEEVLLFMTYPKGSKLRKDLLLKLRNAGNFRHNQDVVVKKKGIVIPYKRPRKEVSPSKYIACEYCLGFFIKTDLWRHAKTCSVNTRRRYSKHVQASMMLVQPPPECSTAFFEKVICRMKDDAVTTVVKNDNLILSYGSKLFEKHISDAHIHTYISQKMRELARLVQKMNAIDNTVHNLQDCISVTKLVNLVRAVKSVCGYSDNNHQYSNPSLALKLGHSLKHCANILKGHALRNSDKMLRQQCDEFKELCSMEWSSSVSSHALNTISRQKWNKPQLLPVAQDMTTLKQHLSEEIAKWKLVLKNNPSKIAWEELCQATLAAVILFNRRRSGEAQRLELAMYQGIESTPCNPEIMSLLSKFEQQLCNTLTLVNIRGKRGRKVPVLLTEETREAIDLLVKHRQASGVNDENMYVFARANHQSLECYRGHDVLRKYARECGAKHPELITSTKLRKHIATMSQVLNLKANELDNIASFMGHDLKVHRDFYRLPDCALTLAKTSKLFLAADKGKLHKYHGKNLDDVELSSDDMDPANDSDESEVGGGGQENQDASEILGSSSQSVNAQVEQSDSSHQQGLHQEQKSNGMDFKKVKKTLPRPWSHSEKSAVKSLLSKYFVLKKVPGKNACDDCISKAGGILNDRSWKHVKYFVHNQLLKQMK